MTIFFKKNAYSFEVFVGFLSNKMVKFQCFGLKSFVMGFKLKEIVFILVFTRYRYISRLCTFFNEASIYHRVFLLTFDKLKLGN